MADANQERDGAEMRERLHVWDDDESDELFYTDRYAFQTVAGRTIPPAPSGANEVFTLSTRWRATRARFLKSERAADERSRAIEERQAEHLRQESESFLAKQMEEMQSLADEQRKAGLLLEDGAPVKLSIASAAQAGGTTGDAAQAKSATTAAPKRSGINLGAKPPVAGVFGAEEEDDDDPMVKRKAQLVKIDFGGFEADSKKDRLEKLRASIKSDQDSLFKAKIRWDGITDVSILTKMCLAS